ncbi:MAG: TRAP transporter large permease [Pelagimonas sp.]|uniref:TRAP transporter large permease n=1 Tax=Pelagimonas sp. TaxID=2073170 RepID=UPI003D6B6685
MTWALIFGLIIGGLVLLMATGLPIAFAFLTVTSLGVLILQGGGAAFQQLIMSMTSSVSTFALVPIPLFVFMGAVLWHSDIGRQAVNALDKMLGRLPGRLSLLTMASGSVFSALSGSTMANTAMLGKLMMPQLLEKGYSRDLSMGPIMAAGGLAMMIPPSTIAVILATLAKLSVAKVLIAAIVPGLMMAVGYVAYIIARATLSPNAAPAAEVQQASGPDIIRLLARDLLPLGLIVLAVTGLIVIGVATPTEAAALGALSALLLCAIYRKLSFALLSASLHDTLTITVMTLAILAGAQGFSQILAYSGATSGMLTWVLSVDLGMYSTVIIMMLIVLILGCFMDQIAIMLIALPFFLPIVKSLGFDPIVFAILLLINLETALMTPPLGLLLVVMKGAAPPDTSFGQIYRAVLPFIAVNIVVMALLILFPELVSGLVQYVFS